MDAVTVKDIISTQNIIDLLEDLGAAPKQRGNVIYSKTICHYGSSHKLLYYPNDKRFHCYSGCGCSYDIFGLIEKVMEYDFNTAKRYICSKFGINYYDNDTNYSAKVDMSFFKHFELQEEQYEIRKLNKKLLRCYDELYPLAWVKEGILPRSMAKFGIRFSISDNAIVIPHFDLDGNLIGVRVRNMDEALVAQGMKYFPLRHKRDVLRHPTGAALYGLNFNRVHIEKYKTIILFEAEKSVMQLDSMWADKSIGASVSGSALSMAQVDILKSLDIERVIIAPDKEFMEAGSNEEQIYQKKIRQTFLNKLDPYFNCSVLWDSEGLLGLKDSPTDLGKEAFEKLWANQKSSLTLTN